MKIFERLLAAGRPTQPKKDNHAEGERLFKMAMAYATVFDCNRAIELYGKSFEASPNPAPLINRANLLAKRLEFEAAVADLTLALTLDAKQANQFQQVIRNKLTELSVYTSQIERRSDFINSLNKLGAPHVAARLIQTSFNIEPLAWDHSNFQHAGLEYFFFNELDNIKKFDDPKRYTHIQRELEAYPDAFIQMKIVHAPSGFFESEAIMYSMLVAHTPEQTAHLRDGVLYLIHDFMMRFDYGGLLTLATEAESNGVIMEAHPYL